MATRFYFSAIPTGSVQPSFDSWTRTDEGDRRIFRIDKDKSGLTRPFGGSVDRNADETILDRQFISEPMAAGILFDNGVTVKGQVRCVENANNNNINRQPISIRIFSRDGTTLRATLLALAHYGPATTEWPFVGTLVNRKLADGDVLTGSYTTVAGDRLVLEIGGQVSSAGGSSVTGQQRLESAQTTDLPEDETTTANNNSWFEFSNTITFEATDWLHKAAEIPKRLSILSQLREGIFSSIIEPIVPVAPSFGWFRQSIDPIRASFRPVSGILVSPEEAIAPFGWLVPLTQRPIILAAKPPGHFSLVEIVAPAAPTIDWLREHDVVKRLPISIQLGFFAFIELVEAAPPPETGPGGETIQLDTGVIRMPSRMVAG